jgi:hypothetical protein
MPFFFTNDNPVTIKTPKYVIHEAKDEKSFVRQHWLMFSLIGLAILTFLIGKYSNIDVLNAFQGQKKTWVEMNQQLTEENEQQRKSISVLQTEVKVKQQAINELQKDLLELTEEKDALKAELVFYENLLSHKDDIKTLRVFDIGVQKQGDVLLLSMVLAQRLQRADVIKGQVKLELKGIQNEQGKILDLVEQFKLNDAFEFKYFQVKKYTISLPKGFNPTMLLVELNPKSSRQKTVTEQFQWSDIINRTTAEVADEPTESN